jgi:hypothetical protein
VRELKRGRACFATRSGSKEQGRAPDPSCCAYPIGWSKVDIGVDVNGDGVDDYDVVGADLGALTAGTSSGQMAVAVFDLRTSAGSIQLLADAPTDSGTSCCR